MNKTKYCLITFDIEEWFQVENLKGAVSRDEWDTRTSSVVKNTGRILSFLERHNLTATFFILGWVAKRHPGLVREISNAGHEVASHGYDHELTYNLDDHQLAQDVSRAKKLLEDITGKSVIGYRAPSFSVDDRLIDILKDTGYKYDSSYSPFKLNNRYGTISRPMSEWETLFRFDNGIIELPLSMLKIGRTAFPVSGGAYFRLLPLWLFSKLARRVIEKDNIYNFYLHPWEFEPEQPRIRSIRFDYRIRHYTGLKKTEQKLDILIRFLKNEKCKFVTINEYIESIENQNSLKK